MQALAKLSGSMTEGQCNGDSLSVELKKIFLYDYHNDNNAKFSPFAGYLMPTNYLQGIIKENLQVRSSAGLFDVSHMGQILVLNTDSNLQSLEKYIPLDLSCLKNNKSYYSFILNSNGGVIDDIMLSKIKYQNLDYLFIVYNAGRKDQDESIFDKILTNHIYLRNNSLLAIQGPFAENIFDFLSDVKNLKFMNSLTLNYLNHIIIVTRSGYTGEDGFEISISNKISKDFIKKIMLNDKIKLCGLGARDSLRLEAGLCLYGNELNESITPIDANLKWALNKKRLIDNSLNGHKNLTNQIINGPKLYKIALKSFSRLILRKKMQLMDSAGNEIGYITSGTFSPSIKASIAIGYVNKKLNFKDKIFTTIRNNKEELQIVKLPFILHKYKKG